MMASVTLSRRAVNRSSEDCYASPSVPSPGWTATFPNPHPAPQRRKRSSGSSSDSDQTTSNIRVEDFRVGGPYLCILPAMSSSVSQQHPAFAKFTSQFQRDILDRLERHSVQWKALDLLDRQSARYDDSRSTVTVVVSASRNELDRSWLDACLEILDLFQLHDLPTLNIEIIDERASKQKYTFPVFETDKIYSKWNELSTRICELVGMEGWLSLECFRRGTDPNRENNPPTIVLTIPMDSPKSWRVERDHIASLLDAEDLQDVAVEVLRSYVWRVTGGFGSVVLPDNAWKQQAQLGMSIGPHGSDIKGSTFGGFVQLQHPGTKQWNTFGLTCYHCIEPVQEGNDSSGLSKDINKWREAGITVNDAKIANIGVDMPALKDHLTRMNMIKAREAEWMESPLRNLVQNARANNEFIIPNDEVTYGGIEAEINQSLAIKDEAEKFFATGNALLGRVFAASGYRMTGSIDRRQLDWALIRVVSSRIGNNSVPPVGSYKDEDGLGVFLGQPMGQSSRENISHDSSLYKIGRRTNFTIGRYQGLRSLHLESLRPSDQGQKVVAVTKEAAITPKNGFQFSAEGDSGSFVFDELANFVGLLSAGNMETGVAYFTPATILFEDIKWITGARDVRLL
ncbi:hypothetical protein AJ78_08830 [Emergomyces pasteurianus Ep9510]|uniref:Uncharacterized protein n=1 Tax=Emergomyces pasteurianus Ep9510 TaxID=1447872 RepID=A0A1J9P196_9EURO|nr:hypothetical protein AJ78_08830 [Emergomyces pasteurianus Ep9510]